MRERTKSNLRKVYEALLCLRDGVPLNGDYNTVRGSVDPRSADIHYLVAKLSLNSEMRATPHTATQRDICLQQETTMQDTSLIMVLTGTHAKRRRVLG